MVLDYLAEVPPDSIHHISPDFSHISLTCSRSNRDHIINFYFSNDYDIPVVEVELPKMVRKRTHVNNFADSYSWESFVFHEIGNNLS